MEIWSKVVFPVRRVWVTISSRFKPNRNGTGLLELHNEIQTCGYEDIQVMWEMLKTVDSNGGIPKRKHRPFWKVFVWPSHSTMTAK